MIGQSVQILHKAMKQHCTAMVDLDDDALSGKKYKIFGKVAKIQINVKHLDGVIKLKLYLLMYGIFTLK